MKPSDFAWEEYADEYLIDKEDKHLKRMFEWVWFTAANECVAFVSGIGQIGVAQLLHDHVYKDFDDYDDEDEDEEE